MAAMIRTIPSESLVKRLREHRFFQTLSDDHLRGLAAVATCYRFAPGELILLDGEPSAGLWIINRGQVKVFKTSPEGEEHILHLLGAGDAFNDIAALDGGPNPASAAALSAVTACNLSHAALVDAIQRDPTLALTLIRFLSERTRSLVAQVEALALHSARTRVARFLLKQLENPTLSAPAITRATIAAHLGIKPETLSRALASLEHLEAIAVRRTEITILQPDLLRVVALLDHDSD
ncbi:MAG: Crp/Fnr family transcriptional regulator [Anaerolineae bacterium]